MCQVVEKAPQRSSVSNNDCHRYPLYGAERDREDEGYSCTPPDPDKAISHPDSDYFCAQRHREIFMG
jgi:hypothetical protein